jgi:hypothetical protein
MATDLKVSIANVLNNANAGLGVGYNILSSNPYIPATLQSALVRYVGNGTLNGMYMYGELSQSTSSSHKFSMKSVSNASLKWSESVVFGMKFTADIPTATMSLKANFAAHVDGQARISISGVGFGIGGICDVGFSASGGYNPPSGFNFSGRGNALLQVYGGVGDSGENNDCNMPNVVMDEWCKGSGIFEVCIPYPSGASAKACFGLSFDFGVNSMGNSPYCRLSF